ncbi:hypothetical protein BDZ90DRAFT_234718 [Jaminaea rosea]|uniref:SMB domain-containing protein n=1 Tax=Jaminaea rosea TaxID=1569628 RepID=A0A316UHT2_9BASI|nr:hypothetical protein BDZ90DRAFT_234718 [Jaminaea rosea]PWN24769.1 hypothetical protein BDZ90DRAFT_234718 [Jaminaea rosea]
MRAVSLLSLLALVVSLALATQYKCCEQPAYSRCYENTHCFSKDPVVKSCCCHNSCKMKDACCCDFQQRKPGCKASSATSFHPLARLLPPDAVSVHMGQFENRTDSVW